MRRFLTTPTRARAGAVTAAILVGVLVTIALTDDATAPMVAWIVLTVGVLLFLLHDGMGPVTNMASVLAGRPIALTKRGRDTVGLDQLAPELRRLTQTIFGMLVVVLVLGTVGALLL